MVRILLFLLLAIPFAASCAARPAGPPPETSGAEGARTRMDDCHPGCKDNLLCREGACVFEPISCQDAPAACPTPYGCVEGSCKLPGGASCRYASQCASMKCHLGICVVRL